MSLFPRNGIASVSVGTPPAKKRKTMERECIETVSFTIHDYKERAKNVEIESPSLNAHGHIWRLAVTPLLDGGALVQLRQVDREYIKRQTTFRQRSTTLNFNARTKRSRATLYRNNSLHQDGSMVFECDIGIYKEDRKVWYPKELKRDDAWTELYQEGSSETADIAFSVEGKIYSIHKNLLFVKCKKLYEIAKEYNEESPIQIDSVKADTFKAILNYIYTINYPMFYTKDDAIEILVAADRFECISLKLYAESVIVHMFLTPENAAELMVFADSHSCALLKEAAMNMFVRNTHTVKQSDGWSQVRESPQLVEELFDIITQDQNDSSNDDELDSMDVTDLRTVLERNNLPLDGSRKVLVDRLKAHQQNLS